MIFLIYPALSSQVKCNFHVHCLINKCLNIVADMVDLYFPALVPLDNVPLFANLMNPFSAKLVRSRWLDIGLVPFYVFIIRLPVAKPDKVLSRSKKENFKVARLDFLGGILPTLSVYHLSLNTDRAIFV